MDPKQSRQNGTTIDGQGNQIIPVKPYDEANRIN